MRVEVVRGRGLKLPTTFNRSRIAKLRKLAQSVELPRVTTEAGTALIPEIEIPLENLVAVSKKGYVAITDVRISDNLLTVTGYVVSRSRAIRLGDEVVRLYHLTRIRMDLERRWIVSGYCTCEELFYYGGPCTHMVVMRNVVVKNLRGRRV